jgi:hypothetical protein
LEADSCVIAGFLGVEEGLGADRVLGTLKRGLSERSFDLALPASWILWISWNSWNKAGSRATQESCGRRDVVGTPFVLDPDEELDAVGLEVGADEEEEGTELGAALSFAVK